MWPSLSVGDLRWPACGFRIVHSMCHIASSNGEIFWSRKSCDNRLLAMAYFGSTNNFDNFALISFDEISEKSTISATPSRFAFRAFYGRIKSIMQCALLNDWSGGIFAFTWCWSNANGMHSNGTPRQIASCVLSWPECEKNAFTFAWARMSDCGNQCRVRTFFGTSEAGKSLSNFHKKLKSGNSRSACMMQFRFSIDIISLRTFVPNAMRTAPLRDAFMNDSMSAGKRFASLIWSPATGMTFGGSGWAVSINGFMLTNAKIALRSRSLANGVSAPNFLKYSCCR